MTNRNAASMGSYGSTWEVRGYSGRGLVSELIDRHKGLPAIVCGNADGVFEEFEKARKLFPDGIVYGVNDVGMYLEKMDHWVSLHADNLGPWKSVRWTKAFPSEHTEYHSVTSRPFIDHLWEGLTPLFALSGYFAMQLVYIMGAENIVLCGCPGDSTCRFFEAVVRPDFGYGSGTAGSDSGVRQQVENEMKRLPEFKTRVRSLGGWTRDFFGGA